MDEAATGVVPVASLREFFRDSVHGALAKQHVAVDEQTEQYVVNVLTLLRAHRRALYERHAGGRAPEAAGADAGRGAGGARPPRHASTALQRLGDVSLFVAGFFAQGFAAKLVDVDYHIAMGGRAYGSLAESTARGAGRVLAGVFAELAAEVPAAGRRAERDQRERLRDTPIATCCASTRSG